MNSNSTVLVTGGAGAIGANLVKSLINEHHCNKVVIIDDFSSGFHNNLEGVDLKKIELINGNICDQHVVDMAFSHNIDYVYHLAVNFANQNSVDNPEKDLKTNGIGTVKILQASVDNNVKKFLLSSSSCVYKPGDERFIEHGPIELTTPYAITKMLSEYYVTFYSKFHNLPAVIVRYFNSYGPGIRPGKFRGVVPNFFYRAMNGLPLVITGDGSETRPFTYVQDVVNGTICAMKRSKNIRLKKFYGHPMDPNDNLIYNIGNSNSITILQLAEKINDICKNPAGIEYIPRRTWDMIPARAVQNDKARIELNFETNYSVDEGLYLTHQWFRQQGFEIEDNE